LITIACDWGGDLDIGSGGDISVVPVRSNLQQRVIRRLLTNTGDYIWHTNYGAGLARAVGEPYSPGFIEGTILNQLRLEPLVAATPAPSIQINQSSGDPLSAISAAIQYRIAATSTVDAVTLTLST